MWGKKKKPKLDENGKPIPVKLADKDKIFNTPAFNYDEVATLPSNATLLSSNKVNNVIL